MISASGRFDRSRKVRRRVTRAQRRRTRLGVRTEATTGTQWRTPFWAVARKPGRYAKGDITIEHHRRVWRRTHVEAVRGSERRYLGGRKECWFLTGIYEQRHGDRLRVVIGVHMPARVEPAFLRGHSTVDTDVWDDALRRLGQLVEEMRAKYPDAEIVVVGDWNVNLRNKRFRDRIAKELRLTAAAPVNARGKRIGWHKVRGTHGHRVIDWAFTNRHTTVEVLDLTPASDHRPIDVTVHRKAA